MHTVGPGIREKTENHGKCNGEFWYVGNDDWREVCVDAVKFLRNILDDVFKM